MLHVPCTMSIPWVTEAVQLLLLELNFDSVILLSSFSSSCVTEKLQGVYERSKCLYYRRGAFSRLELYASHDWCVIIQNMHGSCPLRCHFVHTFGNNLHTPCIGRMLVFYTPNDLATIGDIAPRLYSCMRALTGSFDWRATSPNAHRDRFLV